MTTFRLTRDKTRPTVDVFTDGLITATIQPDERGNLLIRSYRIRRRPGAVRFHQPGPDQAATLTIDLTDQPNPKGVRDETAQKTS